MGDDGDDGASAYRLSTGLKVLGMRNAGMRIMQPEGLERLMLGRVEVGEIHVSGQKMR